MNKKCIVLLPTYNGEEYIEEQINSILMQKGVVVRLYISDDMSTDKTLDIIKKYNDERIKILPTVARMGSASQNFFRLIKDVDFSEGTYISFSDQDDIWYENKLQRAIEKIEEKEVDAYSSSVIAFWDNDKTQLIDKSFPQKEFDFLFASPGPGCTQVFKKSFMNIFKKKLLLNEKLSQKIELHDWVIYAYARSQGHKWFIDSYVSLSYRQHGNNEFGANSGLKTFLNRWARARDGWYGKQITYIAEFCHANNLEPIKYLTSEGYIGKVKLAFHAFKLRRKKSEALVLAFMLIIPGFKV